MRRFHSTLRLAGLLGLAAGALAGCGGSSATFPFERELVWRMAAGQAMSWRPTTIDAENYRIECDRGDLTGSEILYVVKVRPDYNLFARRPSTRVSVSMRQTKPVSRRYRQLELEFLQTIRAKLTALTSPE